MRPKMRWRLLLAFLVVLPIIEVVAAVQVARWAGVGATLLVLLALCVAGVAVVRHQGARAFAELREAGREQRLPERDLADRVLVLVGGLLLVAPGFVTAALSVVFLLPVTRPLLRGAVRAWAVRHGSMYVATQVRSSPAGRTPGHGSRRRFGGDVVRGEVVDDDGGGERA